MRNSFVLFFGRFLLGLLVRALSRCISLSSFLLLTIGPRTFLLSSLFVGISVPAILDVIITSGGSLPIVLKIAMGGLRGCGCGFFLRFFPGCSFFSLLRRLLGLLPRALGGLG